VSKILTSDKTLKKAFSNATKNTSKRISWGRKAQLVKCKGTKEECARIKDIAERLSKSDFAKNSLEIAYKAGYSISFAEGMEDTAGVCNPSTKSITLSANDSDEQNIATLAHELRHAVQFTNGMGARIDLHNIKTQIMMNRAMEADAESCAGISAWELKEKGDEKPWEIFSKESPLIANAIEEDLEKNNSSMNSENAKKSVLTKAFKAWYKNKNLRAAYEKNHVDNLLFLKEKELLGRLPLNQNIDPEDIINGICVLPNGEKYFKDDAKLISSRNYLSVNLSTHTSFKKIMQERFTLYGLEPDKTIDELPVTRPTVSYNKLPSNKKTSENIQKKQSSVFLSSISLKERQEQSASIIKMKRLTKIIKSKIVSSNFSAR